MDGLALRARFGNHCSNGSRPSGMTALAMIETMKRLWNHVVPLIGRKRIGDLRPKDVEQLARDTGGCQKSPAVAAMHWPKSACAVGRAG